MLAGYAVDREQVYSQCPLPESSVDTPAALCMRGNSLGLCSAPVQVVEKILLPKGVCQRLRLGAFSQGCTASIPHGQHASSKPIAACVDLWLLHPATCMQSMPQHPSHSQFLLQESKTGSMTCWALGEQVAGSAASFFLPFWKTVECESGLDTLSNDAL